MLDFDFTQSPNSIKSVQISPRVCPNFASILPKFNQKYLSASPAPMALTLIIAQKSMSSKLIDYNFRKAYIVLIVESMNNGF